jgi:hypothetical protein
MAHVPMYHFMNEHKGYVSKVQAVPQFRWLVAWFSPRDIDFNSILDHVRFVVDKLPPEQVLLRTMWFSLSIVLSRVLVVIDGGWIG